MNDTKEVQTGCEFMYHLLEDNFVEINDEKGLDNLKDVVSDYFLSSFSLRRDSLSMWRMYLIMTSIRCSGPLETDCWEETAAGCIPLPLLQEPRLLRS